MKSYIKHFWELLWAMTEKELKIRYKNTTLGFLWAIMYPTLQAFVIGFIFQFFYKNQPVHYGYSLFLNLLIWNFFSQTLNQTTPSIIYQRTIIKKAKFPIATIPLSIILCNAFHFLAGFFLFILFICSINLSKDISIFSLAFGFFLLLIFTTGLSLITSSLNVKIRDINFLTQAALVIWFYATPILYPFSVIPHKFDYLWYINPLTSIIDLFQYGFFHTSIYPMMLFLNSIIAISTCFLGIWIFKKNKNNFDDFI